MMKERIILVSGLALLLMSMFSATAGTGIDHESDLSNPVPRRDVKPQNAKVEPKAVVGQNSTEAARLHNITETYIPANGGEIKTQPKLNRRPITPIPFTSKPDQPPRVPPGRIRLPGLFPVFYDGTGDPAFGSPGAAEHMRTFTSSAGP